MKEPSKELTQKVYWLIVTTTVSLTIALVAGLVKEITSIQVDNPFDYHYKEWTITQKDVADRRNMRLSRLDTFRVAIFKKKNYEDKFLRESLFETLNSIRDIDYDVIVLTDLVELKSRLVLTRMVEAHVWLNDMKNNLLLEKKIWELTGKFIVDSRNKKEDIYGDYYYNYWRLFNELGENYEYQSSDESVRTSGSTIVLRAMSRIFKISFILLLLYLIGLFVERILIPAGDHLWKEESKRKKGKGKKE